MTPPGGIPMDPGQPDLPEGIGATLKAARLAKGFSLFALAHELNLSVQILEAVEAEAWSRLPPGRERPHTRLIAERLGVDLEIFPEAWRQLPGPQEQEVREPRQEALERVLMIALTVGSVLLLLWLVVPGRSLRQGRAEAVRNEAQAGPAPWIPKDPTGPFPVVGEVLPEAPLNEEGILVSLRAMDACQASIQGPSGPLSHPLRVSEPWHLRVKGPFTLTLDNAGVVALEVAGRRIRHGRNVGEPWTGSFEANGAWIQPRETLSPNPPTAPETDTAPDEEE